MPTGDESDTKWVAFDGLYGLKVAVELITCMSLL